MLPGMHMEPSRLERTPRDIPPLPGMPISRALAEALVELKEGSPPDPVPDLVFMPLVVKCHCLIECPRSVVKGYNSGNRGRGYYACVKKHGCGYYCWADMIDILPNGDDDVRFCRCPAIEGRRILAKEVGDTTSINGEVFTFQAFLCGNRVKSCHYMNITQHGCRFPGSKCGHGFISVVRHVRSPGMNQGKLYRSCPFPGPDACKFFEWHE